MKAEIADVMRKLDAGYLKSKSNIEYDGYDIYPYFRNWVFSKKAAIEGKASAWDGTKLYRCGSSSAREISELTLNQFGPVSIIATGRQIEKIKAKQLQFSNIDLSSPKNQLIQFEEVAYRKPKFSLKVIYATSQIFLSLVGLYKLSRQARMDAWTFIRHFIKFVFHVQSLNQAKLTIKNDQVVFLVAHYGLEPLLLYLHDQKKEVIEIQHGTLYQGHFGYSQTFPAKGSLRCLFPTTFLFTKELSYRRMQNFGKFSFIDHGLIKNQSFEPANKSHNSDAFFHDLDFILFSQPGLFNTLSELDRIVSNISALLNFGREPRYAVYRHPREVTLPYAVHYINSRVSYHEAIMSGCVLVSSSLSVLEDALELGQILYYFNFRNKLGSTGICSEEFIDCIEL